MLSVVIATRNRATSLRRTLESLVRADPPTGGWEIVVVDNGSTDATAATVAAFAARADVPIRPLTEDRPGKSRAVNTGIRAARGELIAFTDDDVIADPDWARALVAAMSDTAYIGAGGRIVPVWSEAPPRWMAVDGPERLKTVVAFDRGNEPGNLQVPPFGPNMVFRREAFERYGVFRTDLGPRPWRTLPGQDTEFGARLLRAGHRLAWVPGALIRHELQPAKMTRRYVSAWYFGYGRMTVRTGRTGIPESRHLAVSGPFVRRLVMALLRWTVSVESTRRFRLWAQACRYAGAIAEVLISVVRPRARTARKPPAARGTMAIRRPHVAVVAMVPDDFDAPWQSRHHILTRLSSHFSVVWVEPVREWRSALRSWRRRAPRLGAPEPGTLTVYRPPRWLPLVYRPVWLASALERARARQVRRILWRNGCDTVVLSLWRPEMARALRALPSDLAVYHIDDEYRFSRGGEWPDHRERKLIEAVDLVSVHSRGLLHRKGGLSRQAVFIPNGVDYTRYATPAQEPEDLATIPHPRIGYTGYLKQQLDWDLLRALVEAHPDWQFVFVGPVRPRDPVQATVDALARHAHVHMLPAKPHTLLPAYVQHFDVCVMPYRIGPYAHSAYPLKLHEYLASGRPVVATPFATAEEFAHVITTAATPDEWTSAIQRALTPALQGDASRAARRAVARQFDWDVIVSRTAEVIETGLRERAGRAVAYASAKNSRSA